MKCKTCDLAEYTGEPFEFVKHIDGRCQSFEAFIFDSPEDETQVIQIYGDFADLRFEIKFCPMCGREF